MKNTIVVIGGNCGDEGDEFIVWLKKNHPELEIDFQSHSTGVGGGVFDENGDEVEGLSNDLWTDFCNS